jgi:hypothetical protein
MSDAIKNDQEKIRMDLLPVYPIEEIAKVLTFGAKKYADRNWEKGFSYSRVYGALLRHVFAWWGGQDKDSETNLSHLAHAGCCLMFLLEYEKTEKGVDDRPNQPIHSGMDKKDLENLAHSFGSSMPSYVGINWSNMPCKLTMNGLVLTPEEIQKIKDLIPRLNI